MALNPTGLRFIINAQSSAPLQFGANDWAISGPRSDGFDIILFTVPTGSSGVTTLVQYQLNGLGWIDIGGTAAGIYTISGLDVETSYSVKLRATNIAGTSAASVAKGTFTLPVDPRGFRGWNPTYDYGTTADIFIAPYGNDTAGTGTVNNPYRTLTKAESVATPNQIIMARAGDYREKITIDVSGLKVKGYGTEKPRFTAAELLTGLTQCTSADSAILGSILGVNGSPVYKVNKTKTGLSYTNILACTIYECGKRVMVPSDRQIPVDTLGEVGDSTTFWQADGFTVNGSNQITHIVDASVINSSRYTESELLAAKVLVRHSPNMVSQVNITAVNLTTNTITVDGLLTRQSATATDWLFAIQNVARSMIPGTVYIVDNTTDMDIYIYPYNVANIDLIEYGVRAQVFEIGSVPNIELRGLIAEQATGDTTYEGTNIYRGTSDATRQPGYVLENVLTGKCENPTADVARSIRVAFTSGMIIRNCTVWESTGRGIFVPGRFDQVTERGEYNLIEKCHFANIGGAAYLNYTQTNCVFAHNYAERTGFNDHGNLTNAYEANDGCVWWGNEFGPNCYGYLTWQEATDITVAFNYIPQLSKNKQDHRAIADQNHNGITMPPHASGFGYIFNNTITPDMTNSYAAGLSISLDGATDLIFTAVNNICHGITDAGSMAVIPAQIGYNIITKIDSPNGQIAGDFDGTNTVQTNLALVYTNAAIGNFTPIPASPILAVPGQDKSALVTALSTRFTQFTGWTKDYKNQTINWANLPVGADAGLSWVR